MPLRRINDNMAVDDNGQLYTAQRNLMGSVAQWVPVSGAAGQMPPASQQPPVSGPPAAAIGPPPQPQGPGVEFGAMPSGPMGPQFGPNQPPQPPTQRMAPTQANMPSLAGDSAYAFNTNGDNPFSLEAYNRSGASQRGISYDAWIRQRIPQRPQPAAHGAPPAASIPGQTGNPSQDLFDVLVEAGRMDEAFRTSPELFRQQFHEDGTPRGSMGPSDFDKRQKLGGLSEGFLRDVPTAEDARRQKQEAWETENANLRNTDSSFEKKNWVAPYGASREQAAKEYATRMRIYDEAARRGESPEVLAKLHPGIMVGGLQNGDVMTPQQMDVRRKDSLDRQKELWANMRASGRDSKTRLATATKRMNAMRDGYSRGDAERIAGGELPLADFLATQEADAERANQAKIAETMANAESLKMMLEDQRQRDLQGDINVKNRMDAMFRFKEQNPAATTEEAMAAVDAMGPQKPAVLPPAANVPPIAKPSVPVPGSTPATVDQFTRSALVTAAVVSGKNAAAVDSAIAALDKGNPEPMEQLLPSIHNPQVKAEMERRVMDARAKAASDKARKQEQIQRAMKGTPGAF